eukprot:gene707-1166_t
MLRIEPQELVFRDVRLHQAYKQEIVLTNSYASGVDFSIRPGASDRDTSPTYRSIGDRSPSPPLQIPTGRTNLNSNPLVTGYKVTGDFSKEQLAGKSGSASPRNRLPAQPTTIRRTPEQAQTLSTLQGRVTSLECTERELLSLLSKKDDTLKEQDEMVRMLRSRLELAHSQKETGSSEVASGDAELGEPSLGSAAPPRVRCAELEGANIALRTRVQELSTELEAARAEQEDAREALVVLQGERAPELAALLEGALAHERTQMEVQSQRVLALLRTKDEAITAWEQEATEARRAEEAASEALREVRARLDNAESRALELMEDRQGLKARLEEAHTAQAHLQAAVDTLKENAVRDVESVESRHKAEREAREAAAARTRADLAAAQATAEARGEEVKALRSQLEQSLVRARQSEEAAATRSAALAEDAAECAARNDRTLTHLRGEVFDLERQLGVHRPVTDKLSGGGADYAVERPSEAAATAESAAAMARVRHLEAEKAALQANLAQAWRAVSQHSEAAQVALDTALAQQREAVEALRAAGEEGRGGIELADQVQQQAVQIAKLQVKNAELSAHLSMDMQARGGGEDGPAALQVLERDARIARLAEEMRLLRATLSSSMSGSGGASRRGGQEGLGTPSEDGTDLGPGGALPLPTSPGSLMAELVDLRRRLAVKEDVVAAAAQRLSELEDIQKHAQQIAARSEEVLRVQVQDSESAQASVAQLNARLSEAALREQAAQMQAEDLARELTQAEKELSKLRCEAGSHASELAARDLRVRALEEAVEARTSALHEAEALQASVTEAQRRRREVTEHHRELRLSAAQRRVTVLAEYLERANTQLIKSEAAAQAAQHENALQRSRAHTASHRAESLAGELAETKAAAAEASQEVTRVREEHHTSMHRYFELEVGRLLLQPDPSHKLQQLSQQLCASKLAESQLLSLLTTARHRHEAVTLALGHARRAEAAAGRKLEDLEGFVAGHLEAADADGAGVGVNSDGFGAGRRPVAVELNAQLAARTHECFSLRDEGLHQRQLVAELELKVQQLEAQAQADQRALERLREESAAAANFLREELTSVHTEELERLHAELSEAQKRHTTQLLSAKSERTEALDQVQTQAGEDQAASAQARASEAGRHAQVEAALQGEVRRLQLEGAQLGERVRWLEASRGGVEMEVGQQKEAVLQQHADNAEAAMAAMRVQLAEAQRAVREAERRAREVAEAAETEAARLGQKLRMVREDGAVKMRSLEDTVRALSTRGGLHAEVAQLGAEVGALRRSEARLRSEVQFTEERLGRALQELAEAKAAVGSAPIDPPLAPGKVTARAILAAATPHGPSAAVMASAGLPPSTGEGGQDRLVASMAARAEAAEAEAAKLKASLTALQREVVMLAEESERNALGAVAAPPASAGSEEGVQGRELAELVEALRGELAESEKARELSAAQLQDLAREAAQAQAAMVERERALHDLRESAMRRSAEAEARHSSQTAATQRRCGEAERRALTAEAERSEALERLRETRTRATQEHAALEGQLAVERRRSAEAEKAKVVAEAEVGAARREAQRGEYLLEERGIQLSILAETVETLQAGEVGERDQRIVTVTTQLVAARADAAGLERRAMELAALYDGAEARCAASLSEAEVARYNGASLETQLSAASAAQQLLEQEQEALKIQVQAKDKAEAELARECDELREEVRRIGAEAAAVRQAHESARQRHVEQLTRERSDSAAELRRAKSQRMEEALQLPGAGDATAPEQLAVTAAGADEGTQEPRHAEQRLRARLLQLLSAKSERTEALDQAQAAAGRQQEAALLEAAAGTVPLGDVAPLQDATLRLRGVEEELRRAKAENTESLQRLAEAERDMAELMDEKELRMAAIQSLEKTLAKIEKAERGGKGGGGGGGGGQSSVARQLVHAKLAEADTQRKLRVSARAELELRQLLAARDERIAELKRAAQSKAKVAEAFELRLDDIADEATRLSGKTAAGGGSATGGRVGRRRRPLSSEAGVGRGLSSEGEGCSDGEAPPASARGHRSKAGEQPAGEGVTTEMYALKLQLARRDAEIASLQQSLTEAEAAVNTSISTEGEAQAGGRGCSSSNGDDAGGEQERTERPRWQGASAGRDGKAGKSKLGLPAKRRKGPPAEAEAERDEEQEEPFELSEHHRAVAELERRLERLESVEQGTGGEAGAAGKGAAHRKVVGAAASGVPRRPSVPTARERKLQALVRRVEEMEMQVGKAKGTAETGRKATPASAGGGEPPSHELERRLSAIEEAQRSLAAGAASSVASEAPSSAADIVAMDVARARLNGEAEARACAEIHELERRLSASMALEEHQRGRVQSLQADVQAAVDAAAQSLADHPGAERAVRIMGSAAEAVEQLTRCLAGAVGLTAAGSVAAAAAEPIVESQRAVIRTLTSNLAGRSEELQEVREERDRLEARLQALRGSLGPGGGAPRILDRRPRAPCVDAEAQCALSGGVRAQGDDPGQGEKAFRGGGGASTAPPSGGQTGGTTGDVQGLCSLLAHHLQALEGAQKHLAEAVGPTAAGQRPRGVAGDTGGSVGTVSRTGGSAGSSGTWTPAGGRRTPSLGAAAPVVGQIREELAAMRAALHVLIACVNDDAWSCHTSGGAAGAASRPSQAAVEAAAVEARSLQEDLEQLKSEVGARRADLEAQTAETMRAQGQVEAQKAEATRLREAAEARREEGEALRKEAARATAEAEGLRIGAEGQKVKLAQAQAEAEALRAQTEGLRVEAEALRARGDKWKERTGRLRQDVANTTAQSRHQALALEEKLASEGVVAQEQGEAVVKERAVRMELEAQLAQAQSAAARMGERKQAAEGGAEARTEQLATTESHLADLEAQHTHCQERLRVMEAKAQSQALLERGSKGEIRRLHGELQTREKELASVQRQLEERTAEHARIVTSLRGALGNLRQHGDTETALREGLTDAHVALAEAHAREERAVKAESRALHDAEACRARARNLEGDREHRQLAAYDGALQVTEAKEALEAAVRAAERRALKNVERLAARLDGVSVSVEELASSGGAQWAAAEKGVTTIVEQCQGLGRDIAEAKASMLAQAEQKAAALRATGERRNEEVSAALEQERVRAALEQAKAAALEHQLQVAWREAEARAMSLQQEAEHERRRLMEGSSQAHEAARGFKAQLDQAEREVSLAATRVEKAAEASHRAQAAERRCKVLEAELKTVKAQRDVEAERLQAELAEYRRAKEKVIAMLESRLDAALEDRIHSKGGKGVATRGSVGRAAASQGRPGAAGGLGRLGVHRLHQRPSMMPDAARGEGPAKAPCDILAGISRGRAAKGGADARASLARGFRSDIARGANEAEATDEGAGDLGSAESTPDTSVTESAATDVPAARESSGALSEVARLADEVRRAQQEESAAALARQLRRERRERAAVDRRARVATSTVAKLQRRVRTLTADLQQAQRAAAADSARLREQLAMADASSGQSREEWEMLQRQLEASQEALRVARAQSRKAKKEVKTASAALETGPHAGGPSGASSAGMTPAMALEVDLRVRLEDTERRLQSAKSAASRKDAVIKDLKAKMDALRAEHELARSGAGAKSELEQKVRTLKLEHVRKDALLEQVRHELGVAAEKAVQTATNREREHAAALTKRMRGELQRKEEAVIAAREALEESQAEVQRIAGMAQQANTREQAAWEVAGGEAQSVRQRAEAVLQAMRTLATRALRTAVALSTIARAADYSVEGTMRGERAGEGNAARPGKKQPVDPDSIAKLVDMSAEEVNDILGSGLTASAAAAAGPSLVAVASHIEIAFAQAEAALFAPQHGARGVETQHGDKEDVAMATLREALERVLEKVEEEALRGEGAAAAGVANMPALDGWMAASSAFGPEGSHLQPGTGRWTATRAQTISGLESEMVQAARRMRQIEQQEMQHAVDRHKK